MNDEANEKTNECADGAEGAQPRPRNVTLSNDVRVRFYRNGQEESSSEVRRDLYSVMDAVLARLAATTGKEDLASLTVSVNSFEDEGKSEPPADGEDRYEGPYTLVDDGIERLPLNEAVSKLASSVIPSEYALKNMEALCSRLFLRTRMDGCVFAVSSDGTGMSTTLVSSVRDVNPDSVHALYRTLLKAARELRESALAKFPKMFESIDWDSDNGKGTKVTEEDLKGLVLPSGLPASFAGKGVVTPEQIRSAGPRIVRLA